MTKVKTKQSEFDKLPIIGPKPSEKEEKYLREIITIEFYNLEQPGLCHEFSYGDGSYRRKFVFFHGGKYEIPRHIVKWVESRGTPIYKWVPDGKGSFVKEQQGWKPRFSMRVVH